MILNLRRMRFIVVSLTGIALLLGQSLESPNSYVALTVGSSVPSGPSASKGAIYPTSGYLNSGAGLGLQLTTFIMPYLSLNLRIHQSFLPMDNKALGRIGSLFPAPVQITKTPTLSHTLIGFGAGTGFRLDFVSFYVPIQFAMGVYNAPAIEGVQSATKTWIQDKHSAFQVGFSTGVVINFHVLDQIPIGLSLLYSSMRSGDQTFERRRYDRGTPDGAIFTYTAPIRTDLTEVGFLIGYEF